MIQQQAIDGHRSPGGQVGIDEWNHPFEVTGRKTPLVYRRGGETGRLRPSSLGNRGGFPFVQVPASGVNIQDLLDVILNQITLILKVRRSAVFLYDEAYDELWSIAATGVGNYQIQFPADAGAAGWAFSQGQPLILNDPCSDARLFSEIDGVAGIRTWNLMYIPLVNRAGVCIGVIEALNKVSGGFTEEDQAFVYAVSHYITVAWDNVKLHDDLQALNRSRKRGFNRQVDPPASTETVIVDEPGQAPIVVADDGAGERNRPLDRATRNLWRILDLQETINDIRNEQNVDDQRRIAGLIENAMGHVLEICDGNPDTINEIRRRLFERLDDIYSVDAIARSRSR